MVAGGGHIQRNRRDARCVGVREINGDDAPYGARDLIHQSAGLAEVHVLGVLRDPGNRDVIHGSAVVQVGEDGADHVLERGGGGQSGAGQDIRHHAGIEPADPVSRAGKARRHACDQGGGGAVILPVRLRERRQCHGIRAEAQAMHAGDAVRARCGDAEHIQAYRAGYDASVVMVGVVSGQLAPSGDGQQSRPAIRAEGFREAPQQVCTARAPSCHVAFASQCFQHSIQFPVLYRVQHFACRQQRCARAGRLGSCLIHVCDSPSVSVPGGRRFFFLFFSFAFAACLVCGHFTTFP